MIRILFCLFIPLSLFATKPTTVRVLLKKLKSDATIDVTGPYSLYNPHTDELIETSLQRKKGRITPKETGLKWNKKLKDIYEIRIVPKEGMILVDNVPYKGFIEVYNIAGTLNIINEVDVENYLKSRLTNIPLPPLSKESLDALVITERTNLYYRLEQNSYATWQVTAEGAHYRGIPQKAGPIQASVERTRDMILNYKKKPFPTTWGINHAGMSVSYSSIFRKKIDTPPGTHLSSPKHKDKWKITVPSAKVLELCRLKKITNLESFRAEKTDKIYALRLFDGQKYQDIGFLTLQKVLNLKSNDFQATLKDGQVIFEGCGSGMGVGLCLTTAEMLAAQKRSVEKILLTHFPNTQLINLRIFTGKKRPSDSIWN